ILDLIESYREMAASMLDVYLTSLSHKLNEVMKVLTVIATIFIPLTFIVGVYGMNFAGNSPWAMPELEWHYGYPALWLIMLSIAGGMFYAFKRRGWF
ncbi:MAG: CorA family divalent cation transporter, partial [Thiohalomonadaceae bacterium]